MVGVETWKGGGRGKRGGNFGRVKTAFHVDLKFTVTAVKLQYTVNTLYNVNIVS